MRSKENVIMLISFFIIANLLGLLAASELISAGTITQTAILNEQASSAFYFFLMVLIAAGVMLLLYKLKADLFIKGWFAFALFFTTMLFFSAFIPDLIAILVSISLIALNRKFGSWELNNLIQIFAFAGAGAFFGTMVGFLPALIILGLISIYDIVAVFFTEHMVSLAKSGISSGTFMGFMYPKGGKDIELDHEKIKEMEDSKVKSKVGVLGGGDVIIPMIFAISLLKTFGVLASSLSIFTAAIFLYLLLTKAQEGKFYPAMPFVSAGSLLGFSLYYLVFLLL